MTFPKTLNGLLGELIARPSVEPGGDSAGTPHGEAAIAGYVAGLLSELGARVSMQEVRTGRPNVIGIFGAGACDGGHADAAPVVMLAPHLDTVGAGGMTVEPFRASVRDGRIYGRGACDTKGPMAAALWALKNWVENGGPARSRVTWVFAATMGEEALSVGATALCAGMERWLPARPDFAIALEPTELRVVYAAKGVLRVAVEATGKACHASTPERGANAIYRMRPFIEACEKQLGPQFAASAHPTLASASLNLGLITGGRALNIVPDYCRVAVDMRTHPLLDNEQALALIRNAAAGLDVSILSNGQHFILQQDNVWIETLIRYASGIETAPWFSDANVFSAHGIPSVAFGPGSISQAHTKDEFITIEALEAGANALGRFLSDTSINPPRQKIH